MTNTTMSTLRTCFLLSGLLLPLAGAMAQTRPIGKEVEVTRPYDPSVVDAQKIWYDPTISPDSLKAKDPLSYTVSPQTMSSDFGINPIASAGLVEKNRDNAGLGYLRVGGGYLPNTLLDFYISNNNAKTILLGMYANHRAFWGDVTLKNDYKEADVAADNMSNDIGIFIKKPFTSATFSLNADYSGKRFLLYGYDPQVFNSPYNRTYSKDANQQTYNLYNINLQLESTGKESDRVDYAAGASYQYFYDHYGMTEGALTISGMLGKHFNDQSALSVTLRGANYNRNSQLDPMGTNFLLSLQPAYTYTNNDFMAKLGLQFVGDQYDGEKQSNVYPALSASYRIADFFIPMFEVKGETEVNSYRKLMDGCSYINPGLLNYQTLSTQKFRNTYHRLVLVGSIRGDIGAAVSYNLFASYARIENQLFFINEPVLLGHFVSPPLNFTNTLGVGYDDGGKMSLGGELRLDTEPFNLYAKLAYNRYHMDVLEQPIHSPKFETNIMASYKQDKWVFSATFNMALGSYYMWNDLTVPAATPQYYSLDNTYNLGVGVEYFFTKKFSVFGNINNLLNQSYDTFYQYTVPGLMLQGGITYRF